MFFFHFLKNCADIHFYFFLTSAAQQTYPLPKGRDVQMGVWVAEKREKLLNQKPFFRVLSIPWGNHGLGCRMTFHRVSFVLLSAPVGLCRNLDLERIPALPSGLLLKNWTLLTWGEAEFPFVIRQHTSRQMTANYLRHDSRPPTCK